MRALRRGPAPSRSRATFTLPIAVDGSDHALLALVEPRGEPLVTVGAAPAPGSGECAVVELLPGRRAIVHDRGGHVTALAPVIDVRTANPVGWSPRASIGVIPASSVVSGRHGRIDLRAARRALAIRWDDGVDPQAAVELAASGVPLVGVDGGSALSALGASLTTAVGSADVDALRDPLERERHSVRCRRVAFEEHGPRRRWADVGTALGIALDTTAEISVLLPSNRPDDVVGACEQVARQRGVRTQLVVGLHGSHMPHGIEDELRDAFPGDLYVERFGDDVSLGAMLGALTQRAIHPLVAKWDDDDWYASTHLADLVAALDYSGAMLVGKAAEFVYLESLDLTMRRFATGSESYSTTLAGGTLLMRRDDLVRVGWADLPRRVDGALIDAVTAEGGVTYRTHGMGYVLRRRSRSGAGHTWTVPDGYFLRQSVAQFRGLALAAAGFDTDEVDE